MDQRDVEMQRLKDLEERRLQVVLEEYKGRYERERGRLLEALNITAQVNPGVHELDLSSWEAMLTFTVSRAVHEESPGGAARVPADGGAALRPQQLDPFSVHVSTMPPWR